MSVERISTSHAYDAALNNLMNRQDNLTATQEQMTSGKRVIKASDDPAAAARAERARALEERTTASVTDAYADTMADIGVRVQSARVSAQISGATADQADQTVASKTGVNLDEEAAKLIQFQQGYQAAAKVLQVAQAVFDTLLQMAH